MKPALALPRTPQLPRAALRRLLSALETPAAPSQCVRAATAVGLPTAPHFRSLPSNGHAGTSPSPRADSQPRQQQSEQKRCSALPQSAMADSDATVSQQTRHSSCCCCCCIESDDAPAAALEPDDTEARAFARAARAAASELVPGSASSESESAPASRCRRRCSSAASTACVCSGQHRLSRSCGSSRLTEGACSSSSNAWQ